MISASMQLTCQQLSCVCSAAHGGYQMKFQLFMERNCAGT